MDEDHQSVFKRAKILLKSVEQAVKEGPWEKSIFLRATGKKLKDFHDKLRNILKTQEKQTLSSIHSQLAKHASNAATGGQTEVFVSLYNSDGQNMQRWQRLLLTISSQAVSRPVYANQHDVEELIRAKPNKINEGYASVSVPNDYILTNKNNNQPKDRLGNDLVVTKDGSIKTENINYFMHDFTRYTIKNNQLVEDKPDQDSSDQ